MNFPKIISLGFGLLFTLHVFAKAPLLSPKESLIHPPRIIRTCCSFGYEVPLAVIPGVKITETSSIEKLGPHQYLGDPTEGNGIIYTRRGGFIDLGHLRDMADWTAFLYLQAQRSQKQGVILVDLGREGGIKSLVMNVPKETSSDDLLLIAGKIAYDLSVWHEIATWYGCATVPLLPERYSSFSIEDAYSNLLGVHIAMEAIRSEMPYEQAVTITISETMQKLGAVASEAETRMAMESVRNIWWTNDKHLPSRKVLLQRQLGVYETLTPWLVPGWKENADSAFELTVPEFTGDGISLDNYYQLGFKLNYRFRYKKIFPDRKGRQITQEDFDLVLDDVARKMIRKRAEFK